jgi:general secretion pathway protein I
MTSRTDRCGGAAAAAGFTLLEVLVAFAIAALAVGVLMQGATGGLRAVRVAGRVEEATSRARSHMAALGHSGPLLPGTQSGDDGDGYRWRTSIVLLGSQPLGEVAQGAPVSRLGLYAVAVAISWTDGDKRRQVELDSRRLDLVQGGDVAKP